MDGILVINKPPGVTSHDIVDSIRRKFNIRKVGHTGTLDPLATGVLVMLIGRATKLSAKFANDDKEYIARLYLGRQTDTQDAAGKVVQEKVVGELDVEAVKRTLGSFIGKIQQIPPMISAKKYNGVKLYKLARRGKSIARKPCEVKIYSLELLDFNLPEITIKVACSKGTYIRTLCEDIGAALGYPAHMSSLTRYRAGNFSLEEAFNLNDVKEEDIRPI